MICVCVRTRDEAHRISKFCDAYKDVDVILVADGGSIDKTKEIATQYPNVILRDYPGRQEMQNGMWRNNDSEHANFLFEWAYSLKPDWIIYDDCDCFPNYLLKQNYQRILSETDRDFVMAVRIYLWGLDQHFPYMAMPNAAHDKYEASLWAWRGDIDFWTVNVPPAYIFRIGDKRVSDLRLDASTLEIMPPYCLLHYSWDNADRVNEKIRVYRESGLIPDMGHPLDFAGPLAPLPEWARFE